MPTQPSDAQTVEPITQIYPLSQNDAHQFYRVPFRKGERSFKQDSSKKEKEGHLLDTRHLQASLDTEPSYLCMNVRQQLLAHVWQWAWRLQLIVNTTASLPLNEALATRTYVTVQYVTNSMKRFISPKQLLQSPVYLPDMWLLLWPARPVVPNDLGGGRMCGGGGGGARPSLRLMEWAKRGLTSLAASFDFRRMGVISIPSSIGNKRHSSSATRGSISCMI